MKNFKDFTEQQNSGKFFHDFDMMIINLNKDIDKIITHVRKYDIDDKKKNMRFHRDFGKVRTALEKSAEKVQNFNVAWEDRLLD